jgi:hypothetical protein
MTTVLNLTTLDNQVRYTISPPALYQVSGNVVAFECHESDASVRHMTAVAASVARQTSHLQAKCLAVRCYEWALSPDVVL